MTKLKYFLSLVGIVALATLFLATPNVEVAKADDPAVVIDGFGCSTGSPLTPAGEFTTDTHAVTNHKGNINMTCDFVLTTTCTGPAIRVKGFLCLTPFGFTTNTKSITDCDAGTSHMSCQVNGSGP